MRQMNGPGSGVEQIKWTGRRVAASRWGETCYVSTILWTRFFGLAHCGKPLLGAKLRTARAQQLHFPRNLPCRYVAADAGNKFDTL